MCRPSGTGFLMAAHPALKRWAKLFWPRGPRHFSWDPSELCETGTRSPNLRASVSSIRVANRRTLTNDANHLYELILGRRSKFGMGENALELTESRGVLKELLAVKKALAEAHSTP